MLINIVFLLFVSLMLFDKQVWQSTKAMLEGKLEGMFQGTSIHLNNCCIIAFSISVFKGIETK